MNSQSERSAPIMAPRPLAIYVATMTLGFVALYLATRSPIVIGDARAWVEVARNADPLHLHYGEPAHFLQIPLARLAWRIAARLGLDFSLESVFVAISLAGTVAATIFVGLIAAELLRTPAAAWIAAILFGTSLNISTQWNGELYGLALGFVAAALFCALRGRLVTAALLWGLSVLSHSEFVLAAPAFAAAVWMAQPRDARTSEKVGRTLWSLVLAGASCGVLMLAGARAMGKWSDGASLVAWLRLSLSTRQSDMFSSPEIGRAIKGLVTAYTVGGHYWRDLLTGRGAGTHAFMVAAAAGLLVILATFVLLVASLWQRPLLFFALAWLLPFHMAFNWWFEPTVEKYHAGALPGFVLLVTGGLVAVAARLPRRLRYGVCAGYVTACAALNLFGALLPMQRFGWDTVRAERQLHRLATDHGGAAVFIACDDPSALVEAGVPFLRVRSVWTGSVEDIRQKITDWTSDRLHEGKETYVVGRWCLPEEWRTTWSKAAFDLSFLQRSFSAAPTDVVGIPISATMPTNPFNWTRGDVIRLEPH